MIEGTAPPNASSKDLPTQPLPAQSTVCILQLPDCLTEQAGGKVGWANVWKTHGGAVPSITDIYSLGEPNNLYILNILLHYIPFVFADDACKQKWFGVYTVYKVLIFLNYQLPNK